MPTFALTQLKQGNFLACFSQRSSVTMRRKALSVPAASSCTQWLFFQDARCSRKSGSAARVLGDSHSSSEISLPPPQAPKHPWDLSCTPQDRFSKYASTSPTRKAPAWVLGCPPAAESDVPLFAQEMKKCGAGVGGGPGWPPRTLPLGPGLPTRQSGWGLCLLSVPSWQ